MPKSSCQRGIPPEQRRLQQRGPALVTKFIGLMEQTNAEGILVVKAKEGEKETLLTISSGHDFEKDLDDFLTPSPSGKTVTLNLTTKNCVIQEKRDDLRKTKEPRQPLTWLAKLPIEGVAQQVRESIGQIQQPVVELQTIEVLQDELDQYFGDPEEELNAVERMNVMDELEPIPRYELALLRDPLMGIQ